MPTPPLDLTGKIAWVTGAASGIGRETALTLARHGATVIAGDLDINGARATAETCGGDAVALAQDVSQEAAWAACAQVVGERFGRLDVLVNNAGIMKLASIADSDDALFDSQIAINLKGSFNTLREAAKRLREGGRIINLSSSVVGLNPATYGVYAATKAGVEAMTHILTKELRGRNISVNAVAPGPTATALFLDGKPQAVIDALAKAAPLERLGQPGDIANTVAFLAGPDGGWINGQILRANGGMI